MMMMSFDSGGLPFTFKEHECCICSKLGSYNKVCVYPGDSDFYRICCEQSYCHFKCLLRYFLLYRNKTEFWECDHCHKRLRAPPVLHKPESENPCPPPHVAIRPKKVRFQPCFVCGMGNFMAGQGGHPNDAALISPCKCPVVAHQACMAVLFTARKSCPTCDAKYSYFKYGVTLIDFVTKHPCTSFMPFLYLCILLLLCFFLRHLIMIGIIDLFPNGVFRFYYVYVLLFIGIIPFVYLFFHVYKNCRGDFIRKKGILRVYDYSMPMHEVELVRCSDHNEITFMSDEIRAHSTPIARFKASKQGSLGSDSVESVRSSDFDSITLSIGPRIIDNSCEPKLTHDDSVDTV